MYITAEPIDMQRYTWIWYPPFDNHLHDLVKDFSTIQMLLLHWWCQSCTNSWEQTWKAKNSQSNFDGCLLALVAFPWIPSSPLQGCAPTSSMDCYLLIFRTNGLPKNKATLRLFSITPPWRGTALPHSKIVHSILLPPEWEGHEDKWNRQGGTHTHTHSFEQAEVDHMTLECTKPGTIFLLFDLQESGIKLNILKFDWK